MNLEISWKEFDADAVSRVHFAVILIEPRATRSKWFSSRYGSSTERDSLLFLDLSNNSIQHVEGLPSKAKIMLSHNHRALNISTGVLTKAHCLSFQKGTIPDRLYVLIPKALHAPERSRKYQGYFPLATPGPFFPKVPQQIFALLKLNKYSSRAELHTH